MKRIMLLLGSLFLLPNSSADAFRCVDQGESYVWAPVIDADGRGDHYEVIDVVPYWPRGDSGTIITHRAYAFSADGYYLVLRPATSFGRDTGSSKTTGDQNTFIGTDADYSNITGHSVR